MSIFQRWRKKTPIIIVSGLPRSGTSLMMQMLSAGGVAPLTDAHRPPDASNPRGYYEYEPTKRLHNGAIDWVPIARGKAVKVISHQLKYLPANESYRIIFMRRHIGEIIQSQATMLARLNTLPANWDGSRAMREYEQHLIYITRWIEKQPNIVMHSINHAELVQGTPQQITRHTHAITTFISDALSMSLNATAMQDVIDPKLYHHRVQS